MRKVLLALGVLLLFGCPAAAADWKTALGKKPALFGPFAKLRFGMTAAQVKAAAPELNPDGWTKTGGLEYWPMADEPGKPVTLNVRLPADGEAALRASWGRPVPGHEPGVSLWFDPAAGVRAALTEQVLTLTEYLPNERLLGPGPDVEIDGHKLLGATKHELEQAFGTRYDGRGQLTVPAGEGGDGGHMPVNLDLVSDRVAGYSFNLLYLPGERDAWLATMERKWGKRRQGTYESEGLPTRVAWRFERPGIVVLDMPMDSFVVGYEPPR